MASDMDGLESNGVSWHSSFSKGQNSQSGSILKSNGIEFASTPRYENDKQQVAREDVNSMDTVCESNDLSISTLSFSSSDEADVCNNENDDMSERFWKFLDGSPRNVDLGNEKRIASMRKDERNGALGSGSEIDSFSLTGVSDLVYGIEASSNAKDSSSLQLKSDLKNGIFIDKAPFALRSRQQSTPIHANYEKIFNKSEQISVEEMTELKCELLADEFYYKILKQRESKCKAKTWVKWTTVTRRRAKERMRSVFSQWKEIHLKMKREFLLLGSEDRRKMKKNYYEWKYEFDFEQRNKIASFHFKLSVLTKCLQLWKVYIAEKRVKIKMDKLARLHFEFHSKKKSFVQWKNSVGQSTVLTRDINKHLLLRVFNGWRKWTQYSRLLHRRQLSSCKEYHNRLMRRNAFNKWRQKLNMKMAFKHFVTSMLKRSFTLWRLKSQRILLRRRISIVHSNVVLQRKAFTQWIHILNVRKERRKLFVRRLNNIQLKESFLKWKEFTIKTACITERSLALKAEQSKRELKKAFGKWKHKIDVLNFKERISDERIKRCVRFAAFQWRSKLIEKKLHQKLIAAAPFFEFLKLKRIFKQWLREKQNSDRKTQRAKVIATFINRGCLARIFTEWRIVTQEDKIIHHLVSRKYRREVARSFDAWRLVLTRRKVSLQYKKLREMKKTREIFLTWREKCLNHIREREAREYFEKKLLNKNLTTWKEITRIKKRRIATLSREYFDLWQKKCENRKEARERRDAAMASRQILLKTRFRLWLRKFDNFRRKRKMNEHQAEAFCANVLKIKSLQRWKRQFHIHCLVSEYCQDKHFMCLDNAFRQWKEFVQQQLQEAVGRFTDRLERESPRSLRHHTLSESYSSSDIPLLRSSSGYFGSLPNIAKMSSPLPISPLAVERSFNSQHSSVSASPDHILDRSPRSGVIERSHTFSSPENGEQRSNFERTKSLLNEGAKPSNSILSNESFSNRNKSPIIVPPLFTNGFRDEDEEYCELVRPSPSPALAILNRANLSMHREQSVDDENVGSIYGGHNNDEDAMSYYSFRSGSNGVDKEHLVSGTIRHWRHLPLSRTFRAWLKYTQDKKLRVELLHHFVSCKQIWTAKRVFTTWRRKLYCRIVVERFVRVKLLGKYFKAIRDYFAQEKSKEERNIIAQLHLKNMKMTCVFKSWRRKVSAKKRLHSLVGRWQEAVHISESDKIKSDNMIKKKELRMLRTAFEKWKDMNSKFSTAEILADTLLMKRTLKQWRAKTISIKLQKHISDKIRLSRTKKVFFQWKESFDVGKRAKAHLQNVRITKFKNAFYLWLQWTKERKDLSNAVVNFQRKTNFKLMAQAFFVWSEEAERLKVADDHFKESLLVRIIESWHEYTERRIDLSVRLEDYRTSSIRMKIRNTFDWWKRSAIGYHVFKEKQKRNKLILLQNCFLKWRKNILKEKSERFCKKIILGKTFSKWFNKCFQLHKQRWLVTSAAQKWLLKTRANRSLDERCRIHIQNKEMDLKQKFFIEWRDEASRYNVARSHYESKLISKVIGFWCTETKRRENLQRSRESTERVVEWSLVSSSFYTWLDLHRRRQRNEMVLENYLELKQQEMLKLCLMNFKKNALKARGEHFERKRLQKMVWEQWNDELYRRNAITKIRRQHIQTLAIAYADKWRMKTKNIIELGLVAERAKLKHDKINLKKNFQFWFLKTRARSLAKICFQGHLLKSTFVKWKTTTKLKTERRKMLCQHIKNRNLKELKRRFQTWTQLTAKSQNDKRLQEVHDQIAKAHFRKNLVEKCFHGWRNECIVEKMRRKRELKIYAEYFGIWKNHSIGCNRAEQMLEKQLMEKAWVKWRKLKIRRDVIRAMEVHENRKQLSEVFSAWYVYTYIRRKAIKDFQTIKKKRLFRKWMQEYNKS